jgi:hypothetical protein
MKMKSYLTEWKKYKYNILTENENISSIGTVPTDPVAAAAAAAEQQKKNQELLKAKQEELQKFKKEITTIIPDKIKQLEDEIEQLSKSLQQEESPMSVGGRQDGSVGNVPYSVLDEEELTEEELEEASGCHEGIDEAGRSCQLELQYEEIEEEKTCNECRDCLMCGLLTEAKYKGRTVPLNKPMRGDVKKFKVYVRDPSTGNIKKVNFGDKKMRIKKSNPKRRKSFRARHNCANPGPKTKARYWSCRKW